MDEVRPGGVEAVETETPAQRELLQGDETLRPGAGLEHGVTAVIVGNRRLDGRLPLRQIVRRQHAAMAPSRGVHDLTCAAERVDRLGDEALAPRFPRARDLGLARAALRFFEDALI